MGEHLKKLQAEITKLHSDRLNLITELKASIRINRFLYETYQEMFKELNIDVPIEQFSKAFMDRVTKFAVLQAPDLTLHETPKPTPPDEAA
jgi:hypothetical protein